MRNALAWMEEQYRATDAQIISENAARLERQVKLQEAALEAAKLALISENAARMESQVKAQEAALAVSRAITGAATR